MSDFSISISISIFIAIGLVLVLVLLWPLLSGGQLPQPFRSRICQGRAWRDQFPSASKSDIRAFLKLFVGAFASPEHEMLKFAPSDEPLAICRAFYPQKWMPDALEFETLTKDLEHRYGLITRIGLAGRHHPW